MFNGLLLLFETDFLPNNKRVDGNEWILVTIIKNENLTNVDCWQFHSQLSIQETHMGGGGITRIGEVVLHHHNACQQYVWIWSKLHKVQEKMHEFKNCFFMTNATYVIISSRRISLVYTCYRPDDDFASRRTVHIWFGSSTARSEFSEKHMQAVLCGFLGKGEHPGWGGGEGQHQPRCGHRDFQPALGHLLGPARCPLSASPPHTGHCCGESAWACACRHHYASAGDVQTHMEEWEI